MRKIIINCKIDLIPSLIDILKSYNDCNFDIARGKLTRLIKDISSEEE